MNPGNWPPTCPWDLALLAAKPGPRPAPVATYTAPPARAGARVPREIEALVPAATAIVLAAVPVPRATWLPLPAALPVITEAAPGFLRTSIPLPAVYRMPFTLLAILRCLRRWLRTDVRGVTLALLTTPTSGDLRRGPLVHHGTLNKFVISATF